MPREAVKHNYGIIQVISGPHAGKVGFYDDDTEPPARAIVYFGRPLVGRCYEIPYSFLRVATQDQKIEFEITHLAGIPADQRDFLGI